MIKLAIVYFTKTGVTGALAKALTEGALSAEGTIQVYVHAIEGKEIIEGRFENSALFSELRSADAIVFGSPTYMGNASAQFKAFADATSEVWCEQGWAGKLAAGFTCGSALNGDQSNTLQYFMTLANQHGMLWVGLDAAYGFTDRGVNRMGCQSGVVAQAEAGSADKRDLATAHYLGKRIALQTIRLTSGGL